VAPAHSIPAQGQRTLLSGGACLQLLLISGGVEDTAGCHNRELVLHNQESECSADMGKEVLQARSMTAKGQPGRDGT